MSGVSLPTVASKAFCTALMGMARAGEDSTSAVTGRDQGALVASSTGRARAATKRAVMAPPRLWPTSSSGRSG